MSTSSKIIHLFAGPSLHGTPMQAVSPGPDPEGRPIVWMPPARRGDAQRLLQTHQEPGVMALADGTFHSFPAIGHIELRQLMEAGWTIFGLCSMGAIRSAEMHHLGMKPWGAVAQRFCEAPETPDDEVALVHGAEMPWLPLSEPMVHIREYLRVMQAQDALAAEEARTIAESLQQRWYGRRTLTELRKALLSHASERSHPALLEGLKNFGQYRLKQRDLTAFVEAAPWLRLGQPS